MTELTDEEIENLPDEMEGENVEGLKNALIVERAARKEARRKIKAVTAVLKEHGIEGIDKLRSVLTNERALNDANDQMELKHEEEMSARDIKIAELQDEALTGRIGAAVAKHRGNTELLMPVIRAAIEKNPDIDLDVHVAAMRTDETFAGAFASPSSHSGSGSEPQKGNDSNFTKHVAQMPTRRSMMSDREKIDFQKDFGLDAFLDLPG